MRKIREVLRLKDELSLSHRAISASMGISRSTVSEYVARAERAGLTWAAAKDLSDAEVEARLFHQVGRNEPQKRAPIDFVWVHQELRRPGVTLQRLWTEYQEGVASGPSGYRPYQYSQFCDLYKEYRSKLSPSMRQVHPAGEKAFLDFSGKKPSYIDPATGEETEAELFVMVLGASNYTYAEATRSQKVEDFVSATVRGLTYYGAVPALLVPDQLKSAVNKSDWCEPEVNATYAEMAQHYGLAVVPARPGKPRDKAKVEACVQVAQRWIVACLRNRRFFSLDELNTAIWELLEGLNTRPFQKLEGCRRSAFESIDRPAMKPLPAQRYELGRWKQKVGVNIDYHVEYDHRYYSVPCELVNEKVELRVTERIVEVWRGGVRVTSHERSYGPKGTAVTKLEHRPRSHREFGDWPPERLVTWAQKTGPSTAEVIRAILSRGPHPESGRRACLALLRMGDRYGGERLEAACARALRIGNPTRKSVEAILKSGLDRVAVSSDVEGSPITHENIRGGDYFDRGETRTPSENEIEAHYLAEERLAIKTDARVDVDSEALSGGRRTKGTDTSSQAGAGLALATSRPSTHSPDDALAATLQRLQLARERNATPHRMPTQRGYLKERPRNDTEDQTDAAISKDAQHAIDTVQPSSIHRHQGSIQ